MSRRFVERNVGGNSTYAQALLRHLSTLGVDVATFGTQRGGISSLLSENRPDLLKTYSGDLIHYIADTGPLFRHIGASVLTVHGVASRWISTARTKSQEYVWRKRVSRAILSTDALITVSHSSARDIEDVFEVERRRIHVIPHGLAPLNTDIDNKLSPKLAARIPKDFVLYLGNIEPRKNLIELVRAFSRREVAETRTPLVIAGRPAWNYDAILREIEASKNVIYVGWVSDSDRAALLRTCKIFVFPSLYEGFGFPILEAMQSGAPVLCSNRGSLKEFGGPARIIDELNADGIASAVASAIDDDTWMKVAPNEGRTWAKQFSWQKSARDHLEVYRTVVG